MAGENAFVADFQAQGNPANTVARAGILNYRKHNGNHYLTGTQAGQIYNRG